jgi:hypothetical protein
MKNKKLKKILAWTIGTFFFLVAVLAVHIYIVTRPGKADAQTRVMARVDIKQAVSQDDANKYTTWFYQQKGVDHVLCNAKTDILVFTFAPLSANANNIIADFRSTFHISALRYMPSASEMASGCPVAATSFTYKAAKFFQNIF